MTNQDTAPVRSRLRKGGVLISVVAVMLILGALGVSVIALTQSSEHSYLSANAGSRAYYLAESGLRYAQQVFATNGWLHGRERNLSLQGGETVNVIRLGNNFWATAVTDAGTAKEARARVPMPVGFGLSNFVFSPTPVLIDEFAVFGNVGIALGQNTLIEGDVAIENNDIDIRGDVNGSVLANNVLLSGQGSVADVKISGGIYASGLVDVRAGTVEADIQAAAGISITSAQSLVKGWLFSNEAVTLSGGATVLGHVHSCGADVTIGGNGTVIGTPENPIEIRAKGNVYLSGSAEVHGNVYAGGNIEMIGTAAIFGKAYAGDTITKGSNNTISGRALQHSPTQLKEPICPYLANLEGLELPAPADFLSGGTDITVPTRAESSQAKYTLTPGSYGSVVSPNNSSNNYADLLLKTGNEGHGNYYFDSLLLQNETNLYLDLSGTGDIRIWVTGDVTIGSLLSVYVSTDGMNFTSVADPALDKQLAARVYLESYGNFTLGSGSSYFGSVYTPFANLRVGNSSQLYGSYYSGGGHDIIASTVTHVVPNYFTETATNQSN